MDNKINFYGFETGVLLEKLDKEFDHMLAIIKN